MNYTYNSNNNNTIPTMHYTRYNHNHDDMIQNSDYIREYRQSVIPDKELSVVKKLLSWLTSIPIFTSGIFGTVQVIQGNNLNILNTHIQQIRNHLGHHRTTSIDRWIDVSRLTVPVILKVQQTTDIDDQRAIWYNEAKIHRELSHFEFVPTLFANLCTNQHNIMIMEFVNSIPLQDILESSKTKYNLHAITQQLQEALRAMWKKGIVHLDFHTDNILVTSTNQIKIIDFGMSVKSQSIKNKTRNLTTQNARKFWKDHLEHTINQFMYRKGFNYYHPNGKIISYLQRHS